MATTMNPTKTRSANAKIGTNGSATRKGPRVRGSVRAGNGVGATEPRQYDLLTAALLGAAIGAGTTLLFRRGPSGRRPVGPAWRAAKSGAHFAKRGARYAWDRGVEAWDRVPRDEIAGKVHDYFESARDTIDSVVESELKDLRRAIRRQRKKLGF
jgi:hypothetical protein